MAIKRPTLDNVHEICMGLRDTKYYLPTTSNKGIAGLLLEKLTGIPTSSACWDCIDGEVKAYPLKVLKSGELVPKETVAITMMKPEDLQNQDWNDTRLKKKIENLLFVAYLREGDYVTFKFTQRIQSSKDSELYDEFKNDYISISDIWKKTNTITSKTGKYIQSRTKGAGGNAPKTRAYYFRPIVMKMLKRY